MHDSSACQASNTVKLYRLPCRFQHALHKLASKTTRHVQRLNTPRTQRARALIKLCQCIHTTASTWQFPPRDPCDTHTHTSSGITQQYKQTRSEVRKPLPSDACRYHPCTKPHLHSLAPRTPACSTHHLPNPTGMCTTS